MNKAVFITGAHSGTGYKIAETFAEKGWDVFITSRRGPDAEKAAQKIAADYGYTEDYVAENLTDLIYETMLYDKTMEYLIVNNTFVQK